jgi:predicted nucleic acid-binding protein
MIVVDTSAFISIAIADVCRTALTEYDVHTTAVVLDELEQTAEYDDVHGTAAGRVYDRRDAMTVHGTDASGFQTSRIDSGEATCVQLANDLGAAFLVTDDLRALPELQQLTDARVAISPILLRALVERDVLASREAREKLNEIAASRDWLGAPIYRRARRLFETEGD